MTVNMDTDHEDLYLNLNILLKDICRFLETSSINLSPSDKYKADTLIERSKKQLQIIDKVSYGKGSKICDLPMTQLPENIEISNQNATERYVDMSKKTVLPRRTEIIEPQPCETKCPFQDLPAKEASQEIKYGSLSKRRKVFNILDVTTKVYAAIHENYLLIYGSSKDAKPESTLDLKNYTAKEDETDPNMSQLEITKDESLKKNPLNIKLTSSFKVFPNSSTEKKCYSFVASTHKDMLQWVVNINRRHDKAVLASKKIEEEQNYEICEDLEETLEENIYHEIEMPCPSLPKPPVGPQVSAKDNRPAIPGKPPAAPDKRTITPKNVLPNTGLSSSTESMVSYEEFEGTLPLKKNSRKSSLNSFETSDDEDDQSYDELDTVTRYIKENMKEKNVDVPSSASMNVEVSLTVNDDEDCTYENNLKVQSSQSNKRSDFKNSDTVPAPISDKKVEKSPILNVDTPPKPPLPEKNLPTPSTPKLKILSPKPWKPFIRNGSKKGHSTPQIAKNKPIRESLKNSATPERKTSSDNSIIKENSAATISNSPKTTSKPSVVKENSPSHNNDSSKTPSDIWSSKPNQGGSIVRIMRNKWSPSRSSSFSLETFSRNTKIETFQASSTTSKHFLGSPDSNLKDSLRQIESIVSELSKNDEDNDAKPMVLLKDSLEDENTSKKLKKSPVVPVKPKKVAKKLAF